MKVYASPVPAPETNYANYDRKKELQKEQDHQAAVKQWLKDNGYTGKLTGEVVSFQVADGYAQYMVGDGRKSCLIHLPYGDAYQYGDVRFLPKSEIIKRLEQQKRWETLFTVPA